MAVMDILIRASDEATGVLAVVEEQVNRVSSATESCAESASHLREELDGIDSAMSAYEAVVARIDAITAAIQRAQDQAAQGVQIEIYVEGAEAAATQLDVIAERAQAVGNNDPTITPQVDVGPALDELSALEGILSEFSNRTYSFSIDASAEATLATLDVVISKANEVGALSPSIHVAEDGADAVLAALGSVDILASDMNARWGSSVHIRSQADGTEETISLLQGVQAVATSIDGGTVTLRTGLDGYEEVLREFDEIEGAEVRIDGDQVVVTARVDGTEEGVSRIDALAAAAGRIDGRNLSMSVDLRGVDRVDADLVTTQALADHLDGKNVNVHADESGTSSFGGLKDAINSTGEAITNLDAIIGVLKIPLLITGIAAVTPVAVGAAGAVLGLAQGLGEGLVGAATAGAGALALAAGGLEATRGLLVQAWDNALGLGKGFDTLAATTKAASDQLKSANELLAQMPPGTEAAAAAQDRLAIAQQYQAQATQIQIDWFNRYGASSNQLMADTDTLRLRFVALTSDIGGQLIPTMDQFVNLGTSMLPMLVGPLQSISLGIQQVGANFLTAVQSGNEMQSIQIILNSIGFAANAALSILSNGFLALVPIIAGLTPTFLGVLGSLNSLTSATADWVQTAQGAATISAIETDIQANTQSLIVIVGQLALGFYNVFQALNQANVVDEVMGAVMQLATSFNQVTQNGTATHTAIVSFMSDVMPILGQLGQVVLQVGSEFLGLANDVLHARDSSTGLSILSEIITSIGQTLPYIRELFLSTFQTLGPLIAQALPVAAQLVEVFVSASPPLGTFLQAVINLGSAFTSLPGPVQSAVADFVALNAIMGTVGGPSVTSLIGGLGSLTSSWLMVRNAQAAVVAAGGEAVTIFGTIGTVLSGVWGALTTVGEGVMAFGGSLLALNPITIAVVAAIALVAGAAYLIYENWGSVGPWLSSLWSGIVSTVSSAASAVVSGLQAAWSQIQPIAAAAWNGVSSVVGPALQTVWQFVQSIGGQIVTWWQTYMPQVQQSVSSAFNAIAGIVGPVLSAVWGLVSSIGGQIISWWSQNMPQMGVSAQVGMSVVQTIFQTVLPAIWTVVSTYVGMIVSFWQTVWPGLQTVVSGVWTVISSVIQGAVTVILGIITVGLGVLTGNWSMAWDGLRMIVQGVWTALSGIVQGGVQVVVGVLQAGWALLSGVTSTAWNAISGVVSSAWSAISSVVSSGISAIGSVLSAGWAAISGAVSSAWSAISSTIGGWLSTISAAISAAWAAISSGASSAWSAISSTISGWWNTIYTTVSNSAIVQAVGVLWTAISNDAQRIWGDISSFISSIWATITSTATSGAQAVASAVSSAWDTVSSYTTSVFNAVSSFMSSVWATITSTVTSAAQAVASAVSSAWDTVSSYTTSVFNAVSSFMSSIWSTITSTVSSALDQIYSYLSSRWDQSSSYTTSTFNQISSFLSSIWNTIYSTISSVLDQIYSYLSSRWDAVSSYTHSVYDAISSYLSSIWSTIYSAISSALDQIYSDLSSRWDQVSSYTHSVYDAISSYLSSIWSTIVSDVQSALDSLTSAAQSAWDTIQSGAQAFGDALESIISSSFSAAIDKGLEFLATLLDGAATVLNAIDATDTASLASSAASTVRGMEMAEGGVVVQPGVGGIADGITPHAVYGEAGSPEAYVVKDRPTSEQLPYLQTAAAWHGMTVVGASDTGGDFGDFGVSPGGPATWGVTGAMAEGGILDHITGPATRFYDAGGLSQTQIDQGISYFQSIIGSPYSYGSAGADGGYDCAGVCDSVIDVVTTGSPSYDKWAGTYAWAGGMGWNSGLGTMSVGVDLGGWGGFDGTHMAMTLDGTNIESDIPSGVHEGYGADAFGTQWNYSGGDWVPGSSGGGGAAAALARLISKIKSLWDSVVPAVPDLGGGIWAGVTEWLKTLPDEALKWIESKAASVLGSIGGAIGDVAGAIGGALGFSGGGDPASNQALGKQMAADQYGWTGPEWDALQALWQRESGWDNTAQNPDSTAHGIAQMLTETSDDPATQIGDGLQYIYERYGDPIAALAASNSQGWYDIGGVIPGPVGDPVPITAHGGERVLTVEQNGLLEGILSSSSAAPGGTTASPDATVARDVNLHVEQHFHGDGKDADELARKAAQMVAEELKRLFRGGQLKSAQLVSGVSQ